MYIRRAEIPSYTYAKHNSTVRNQSTEVQWYYKFQHYSPSRVLSQHVIQYYKNITSMDHTKIRITEDLRDMILVNAHEWEMKLQILTEKMNQENLLLGLQASARFRSWDCLRFRYAIRSATGTSPMSKLQNLSMQVQDYQNATQRVHKECQVACTCIYQQIMLI